MGYGIELIYLIYLTLTSAEVACEELASGRSRAAMKSREPMSCVGLVETGRIFQRSTSRWPMRGWYTIMREVRRY